MNNPGGIAIYNNTATSTHNVYIADRGTNKIKIFPVGGGTMTVLGTGTNLKNPTDVAVDLNGNVFVTDAGNHRVVEFIGGAGSPIPYGSGLIAPSGLAVDPHGNVFVSDDGDGTVKDIKIGSYSILPALPNKTGDLSCSLCFDTQTGIISGTPDTSAAQTTYTITAANGSGSGAGFGLVLTINNPDPPVISINPTNYTYTKNIPIVPVTTKNSSTGAVQAGGYSSTTLPTGLILDSNTGALYGTPTVPSSTTTYTITAKNGGGSGTTPITIKVNDLTIAPVISYTVPSSFPIDTTITPVLPTTSGGAIPANSGFAINPLDLPLPAGLVFDNNTGIISGTPTKYHSSQVYHISAKNIADTSSAAAVTIAVSGAPPVLHYSPQPAYTSGTAIKPLAPVNTGGPVVGTYALIPDVMGKTLPPGLTFDPVTGIISGKPSTAGTTTTTFSFKITCDNNSGGTYTSPDITITVFLPVIPNISYITPLVYAQNAPIVPIKPVNYGGPVKGAYAVFPSLPAGLVMDTQTGIISGTPTAVSSPADYAIRVSNDGTTATRSLAVINIEVKSISYINPPLFTTTNAITPIPLNQPLPIGGAFVSPMGLAVAGANLYVADNGESAIKKLPVSGGIPITIGYGFNHPVGVAVDSAGDVFVADGDNSVKEIPFIPASGTIPAYFGPVVILKTSLTSLNGIAVDNSGTNFYVSQGGAVNTVAKIAVASPHTISYTLTSVGNPTAVALATVSGTDYLYVADNAGRILQYNATSPGSPVSSTISAPTSVCVDGSGNIFVGQSTMGAVVEIKASDLTKQWPLANTIDVPSGIAIDGTTKNLYVSNNNSAFYGVFKIGAYSSPAISPGLPTGLSIDSTTSILSGTPSTVTPAANYTVTATSGGNSVTTIINNLVVTTTGILVNNTGVSGFQATFTGISPFSFNTDSTPAHIPVPPNNYTNVTVSGGSGTHTFSLTGFASKTGTTATFANVNVVSGAALTLTIN